MIDLIFVIINTTLAFVLLGYISKKYIKPFLTQQHKQELLEKQQREQALSQIEQRITQLETARLKQEEEFAALQESVLVWRNIMQEQSIQKQHEFAEYSAAAKAKQLKQVQNYEHEQTIKAVKPLVLKELANKARAYMQDTIHQRDYASKALEAFERIKHD